MNIGKLVLPAVFLLISLLCAGLPMPALAQAQTEAQEVDALEPFIGGYPPSVGSPEEMAKVTAKYEAALSHLNRALEAKPRDMSLLYQRGRLQAMGHNMDVEGAFERGETDLQAVIAAQPKNTDALLALGRLYINSSPERAPRAEVLFNRAQAASGPAPLEEAPRGLFFAYYYQGQIDKALRQTEFLVATWPKVEVYGEIHRMVLEVKNRDNKKN